MSKDHINPDHYKSHPSGVECIDVTRHMSFNCGNAVKYIWRNGLKDGNPSAQDLKKAIWYLQDEVNKLEQLGVNEEEGVPGALIPVRETAKRFACSYQPTLAGEEECPYSLPLGLCEGVSACPYSQEIVLGKENSKCN